MEYRAAVITVSDKGSRGEREDTSGPALAELLEQAGYAVDYRCIIPDERAQIEAELIACCDERDEALVLTTGGTGFSLRDVTPEATLAVVEREVRGIPEAMRYASLQITPRACLSRVLENIRRTDAIVHVVRCFDDENIMHVVADASTNVPVDPLGDIETIDLELIMADLEMVNRRVEKATKMAKGDKKFLHEVELFSALAKHLDAGKSARTFEVSSDDAELIATADLLSLKPIIYAANMDEDGFANQDGNQYLQQVKELADREGAQVLPICAKLEQDIAELDGEDRAMFLEELGIQESGLDRLIKCSYALLGLISFLTYGEDECRAWTIKNGTKAPQAAGKIHSDIERGFIRAETINFDDMIRCGSVAAAKEKGLLRSEGKEYVVKDGDMIYFRFNV